MNPSRSWIMVALSNGIPRRSIVVAVIVGSVLNVINQGDVIFGVGEVNPWKIGLTFVVPYLVATYGAVAAMSNHNYE